MKSRVSSFYFLLWEKKLSSSILYTYQTISVVFVFTEGKIIEPLVHEYSKLSIFQQAKIWTLFIYFNSLRKMTCTFGNYTYIDLSKLFCNFRTIFEQKMPDCRKGRRRRRRHFYQQPSTDAASVVLQKWKPCWRATRLASNSDSISSPFQTRILLQYTLHKMIVLFKMT